MAIAKRTTPSTPNQPALPGLARIALYDKAEHLPELRDFASSRGWTSIAEFQDLNSLLSVARKREIETVICKDVGQFGTSMRTIVNVLLDLAAAGVTCVPVRSNDGLADALGELVKCVESAGETLERSLIQNRVKEGLRRARSKGKRLGRPSVAIDLAKVRKLRQYGLGWRAVARRLDVGVATLIRATKRDQVVA
jgi:DNA invertase Pin-like site-specific DNA recombinase